MTTTTIDDQLAAVRGRIQRLRALERAGATSERKRIRRHLDVLEQEGASVYAALRTAPEDADEKLHQLTARLNVAEHSVAADISGDWASFSAAVEEELRSWDDYLERLQTSVAEKAWRAREQAEAAIADVRSRRIEVDARLAAGTATDAARKRVTAARDRLEQTADELSSRIG
jgi:septal ring factor EnvC (AmiA/AmiB activator)